MASQLCSHCLSLPEVGWQVVNEVEARWGLGHSDVYGGPCALDGQLDYDNPFLSYQQSPAQTLGGCPEQQPSPGGEGQCIGMIALSFW